MLLKIITSDGREPSNQARKDVIFRVGEITMAPDWNPAPVCGGGIHYHEHDGDYLPDMPDGGVFVEVEPVGTTVRVEGDKTKAQGVEVLREVSLEELVGHSCWRVRYAVAENTNDIELLGRLSTDNDWRVRRVVACNTNDIELLRRLSADNHWRVRRAVAKNTDDIELLRKLSEDSDCDVRHAVAENTNDTKLLEKLSRDDDRDVRCAAKDRIEKLNNKINEVEK